MTRDELYLYMREPQRMSVDTLQPLRELQAAYPYCGTFAFLYLYNLSLVKDVRYASELKRLALLLPDRGRLFSLVELGEAPNKVESAESMGSFELIDNYLDKMQTEGVELPAELDYAGATASTDDYFASVYNSAESEDLLPVDNLTADESELVSSRKTVEKSEVSVTSQVEKSGEEELFTETLARIYIKQGHYDKALRIIRSISLNYPKKSLYFADQIRFLERLIINNKLR